MIGLVLDYCILKATAHASGELLRNDNSGGPFRVTCGGLQTPSQPKHRAWLGLGDSSLPFHLHTNSFSATRNLLSSLLHLLLLNTEEKAQPASAPAKPIQGKMCQRSPAGTAWFADLPRVNTACTCKQNLSPAIFQFSHRKWSRIPAMLMIFPIRRDLKCCVPPWVTLLPFLKGCE